uniref:Uncharacterized protein n=2 Tax=Magallana gigas TaxID=29159 RepID=K1QTD2_MAGGI
MMLICIIVSLLAHLISADECFGKVDGVYEVGCRSYVVCHNQHGTIHNCPDPPATNTVFNSNTKTCDNTLRGTNQNWPEMMDGLNWMDQPLAPVAFKVNRDYFCHGDVPSRVPAPCGMWQDCTLLADKRYADITRNCTSYYTCHGGTYFGHNFCNPGVVFDEVMQICNWPQNVAPPCGTRGTKRR